MINYKLTNGELIPDAWDMWKTHHWGHEIYGISGYVQKPSPFQLLTGQAKQMARGNTNAFIRDYTFLQLCIIHQ